VRPPPPEVLRAFAVEGDPVPLAGGQGTSWRAGDAVLKPVDDPLGGEELAALVAGLGGDGFRLARPIAASGGRFVVSGWSASRWLEGGHAGDRWDEVVALSVRLARMLDGLPRPEFLDRLDDPGPGPGMWRSARRRSLRTATGPTSPRSSRISGRRPQRRTSSSTTIWRATCSSTTPRPPAVIDFTPGWRPAGYQTAVVVADAFLWHDAGPALADRAAALVDDFAALFPRAILFRLVVDAMFRPDDPGCRHLGAVERAARWLGRSV
jgi:hypothetical protein